MDTFNTHGGYFAPQGYLKINEGGSHEENPNGGVQLGVDEQGIPNMLEEGEPVYNDYVFSDNIKADGGILEKHSLPQKYSDMLYSDIVEKYLQEAEERPNDPISNAGLKAMLSRVAEAQEEQKQIQQEKELEKELSKLSPEELAELEAMLAAGEQQTMEQVPQEMPAAPMMSTGGFLRTFEDGTPGTVVPGSAVGGGARGVDRWSKEMINTDQQAPSLLELALGEDNKVVQAVNSANDWLENTTAGQIVDALIPDSALEVGAGSPLLRQAGRAAGPVGRSIARGAKKVWEGTKKLPGKVAEIGGRKTLLKEAKAGVAAAKEASAAARTAANTVADELAAAKAALKADPKNTELLKKVEGLTEKSVAADKEAIKAGFNTAGERIKAGAKDVAAFTTGPMYNRAALEEEVSGLRKAYEAAKKAADAAPKDKVLKEAAEEALKNLEKAEGAWNKWWKHGEWQVKGLLGGGIAAYGAASRNKDKREEWINNQFEDGGLVRQYFAGSPGTIVETGPFAGMTVVGDTGDEVEYAEDLDPIYVTASRTAAPTSSNPITGYFMNNPVDTSGILNPNGSITPSNAQDYINELTANPGNPDLISPLIKNKSKSSNSVPGKNTIEGDDSALPTLGRYAGALTSGLLGLYNLSQKPDVYKLPQYKPVIPSARLPIVNPTYNPIDENLAVNAVRSSGTSAISALRNSGLGPSTAAAILAANNNIGQNIGTALAQTREANHKLKNDVIDKTNANSAAQSDLNFKLSMARAQALNDARIRNMQNNLYLQRLNYGAEGDKYAAVSNSIDQMGQALAGIGKENFAMNMIKSNPAYFYDYLASNGWINFNPTKAAAASSSTDKKEETTSKKTTPVKKDTSKKRPSLDTTNSKRLGGTLLKKCK